MKPNQTQPSQRICWTYSHLSYFLNSKTSSTPSKAHTIHYCGSPLQVLGHSINGLAKTRLIRTRRSEQPRETATAFDPHFLRRSPKLSRVRQHASATFLSSHILHLRSRKSQRMFVACLLSLVTLLFTPHVHAQAVLPYNFTLAALNSSLPNANSTGAPLVLGQNGASTGVEFYVTSTYASYPYDDYPSLALRDGILRAYEISGAWMTNATEVQSGGTLGWITTTQGKAGSPVYSVISAPAYEYPLLAAHGIYNLWSLCPFPGARGQTNVVFNVSADISPPSQLGFDPSQCYGVTINVVRIPS